MSPYSDTKRSASSSKDTASPPASTRPRKQSTWYAQLYDEQKRAVEFIETRPATALFCVAGTGKTWVSLAVLERTVWRVALIVAPYTSLDVTWHPRITTLPHALIHRSLQELAGSLKSPGHSTTRHIVLTNPEALRKSLRSIAKSFPWDIVIWDECFPKGTRIRTPLGDRPIDQLRSGDEVCSSSGVSRVKHLLHRRSSVLLRIRFENGVTILVTPNHPFLTTVGWVYAKDMRGRYAITEKDVRMLWSDHNEYQVLHSILLCEMAKGQTIPNDQGGQRERADEAAGNVMESSYRRVVDDGVHSRIDPEALRLSHALQARPRSPDTEDSNRDRRREAQHASPASVGSQEGRKIEGVRVESVEVEEQASPVDVFDLELEGTPHFIAEGFIVHNSQNIKNRSSVNSRLARRLRHVPRRIALSGTPLDTGQIDIWAQMRFVDHEVFGENWSDFASEYCYKTGWMGKEWVFNPRKAGQFLDALEPYVYRLDDSFLGLKPMTVVPVPIMLLGQQRRIYETMQRDNLVAIDGGLITADNQGARDVKLSQITGGAVLDADANALPTGHAKQRKLAHLLSTLEQPVVIFCQYLHELDIIRSIVMAQRVAIVQGATKIKDRTRIINDFQEGKIDVLICQIRTAGESINLTRAATLIMYSMTYSYINFEQVLRRLQRGGQTRLVTAYILYCVSTIDQDKLRLVQDKSETSETILAHFEE